VTVEQLNLKYVLVDRKRDFEVIDFFERNSLAIQNLDEDADLETLQTKTSLISDYGYSLAKNGQSEKSIPILIEALRLHEKHPAFEANNKNSNGYKSLTFLLGEAFHKTNRVDDSKRTFDRLIKLAPDNEAYKTWVTGTKNHNRNRISKVTFTTFVVWLLISVLFRDSMPSWLLLTFNMVGLTLFVIWTFVDIKSYLVKRKYK
jgi:tetratricopeptide (TPR) repeat protein